MIINVNNKTKQGRIAPFLETGIQRILVKNVEIRSSFSIRVTLCLCLCFSFTLTVYANLFCFVFLLTAELSLINTLAAFQRHRMVNLPFSWWIYAIVVYCPQWQRNIKFSTFFLKREISIRVLVFVNFQKFFRNFQFWGNTYNFKRWNNNKGKSDYKNRA